jgi:hypothetical protein
VDHTSDWRQAHELIVYEIIDGVRICDIAAADENVSTKECHFVDQVLDLACCRAASGEENNIHGPLTHHPSSHAPSEAASSSDEDIGGILAEQLVSLAPAGCLRNCQLSLNCKKIIRKAYFDFITRLWHHNQLAIKVSTLQRLERCLYIRDWEDGGRAIRFDVAISQKVREI